MRIRAPLLLTALITLASACPQDRSIGGREGEDDKNGEGECLTATLGPVTLNFQDDVSTHYQAELTTQLDGAAPDFLVLQFFNYNERIGELGVGTFPLDDATNDNYGHCAECLLVFTDQITPSSVPERVFFQSGGSIQLEKNPREGMDLIGRIEDLVLVESTIGGDALESAPVEGGDCLELGDIELNLRYVPEGWTCAPELFNAGDGVCHCDCGAVDTDCFPNFEGPPPTSTVGCGDDQICTIEGCRDTCDAFAGEGCSSPTDVCAFSEPVDYCVGQGAIDSADLGEPCSDDYARSWCAVQGTIPMGVCDFDLDEDGTRICRPRCASDGDCAAGETCYPVVYGEDGNRGYCDGNGG